MIEQCIKSDQDVNSSWIEISAIRKKVWRGTFHFIHCTDLFTKMMKGYKTGQASLGMSMCI